MSLWTAQKSAFSGLVSKKFNQPVPGVKKTHTLILLLICDRKGQIVFVGQLFAGAQVDFTLFKKELAHFAYATLQVGVDLGFAGIKNYLPTSPVQIGHKKPKNQELTQQQQHKNKAIAKVRVVVEDAIGGMKRYFMLRHENRIRLRNKISEAVEICASLWNFKPGFSLNAA